VFPKKRRKPYLRYLWLDLNKTKTVINHFFLRARTDYANRACNVTCNVMLVAKLVPRTADEPSAQRTASILRSLIDRTAFHHGFLFTDTETSVYAAKSRRAHITFVYH
jgi:hypothetical protein